MTGRSVSGEKEMENRSKLNILVLGNSGAGKSTLIKAVSGIEVATGTGEGNTDKISVYESETWPFVFIDTKGFEYSIFRQWQTIRQVKQFTNDQIARAKKEKEGTGIDVVWYCVEGTSRRVFADNIAMMNKALKGWKNVPVFAVITKSYSGADEKENIEAVSRAFARGKEINLQKIIPVVAAPYPIDDVTIVGMKGLEELCESTLACSDLARQIREEALQEMILKQKRLSANTLTAGAVAGAAVVGAVPVSFADSLILVPLETALVKGIFNCYGVKSSSELVTAVVGSTAITNIAKALLAKLKTIPNVAASVLNAAVAGVFVAVLGEAVIALAEAICLGKIDPGRIDEAVGFVIEKLKQSPMSGKAVQYLQDHAGELNGRSVKELLTVLLEMTGAGRTQKK